MLYNGRELSQRSTFETRMSRDDRGSRGRAMSDGGVAVLWARD